jgi:cytosine permease
VGSSTFGTAGGYVMPGLLMGLLQIGWFAVGTFFAADYILRGMGMASKPGTLSFGIVCVLWGGAMAFAGAKGVQYVSKIALFLNAIPLLMLFAVLFQTSGGIANYHVAAAQENSFGAFSMMIAIVIGFFATAGAAGADFGMNARDERDVRWGGLVGITLAVMVAGGLPLMAVAGAHGSGLTQSWDFGEVVQAIGGPIASAMLFLFAIASIPAACFCAFIAGNSFNTMIPSVPRVSSTMAAGAVGVLLAITGVAANLIGFFTIVGASFGPIIGAMVADYLLAGRKWSGPREGVNLAGYGAWLLGFIVGILPTDISPLSPEMKSYVQPAVVYSFIVGFVVYYALAKAGLQSKTVAMPKAA